MLKTSILNFMKRPFIRNVLVLTSGTAMAQVVTMLFTPLITRIYGPEAYGLMGIFSSMLQILSPISALAYPISMILPKNDENSKELGKISFQITIFNTLIVLLLLILFDDFIINIFNLYSVSSFVYLIPFIVLSAGSLQVIQQWLIRHNQFDVSARAHLIETTVVNAGKLGIGLIHPFASVLIFFYSI